MTKKSHTGIIVIAARFSRIEFGTGYPDLSGQVMTAENQIINT